MPKNVIITGVGGFIGAHFLEYFLANTDWNIIGMDSFMHKGTFSRLDDAVGVDNAITMGRFEVMYHDLAAPMDDVLRRRINNWFASHSHAGVDYIINLASNSAVERSAVDPSECWRNNCNIILHMLEYARYCQPKKFFQISTDEIYGDYAYGQGLGHAEWDTIVPSNPYAASKAAQEALSIAYWRTFEVPVIILNTMNNIGERQDPEKFLPKIIKMVRTGERLSIYTDNDGEIGSRVYLDAKNHAAAVLFLTEKAHFKYNGGKGFYRPSRFNICGEVELNNLQLAQLVAQKLDKELRYELVPAKSARPGYDKRYLLDGSALRELGFVPPIGFEETIDRIIKHSINEAWY